MTTESTKRHGAKQSAPKRRTPPQRNEGGERFFSKEMLRAYLVTLAIGGGLILILSLGA